MSRFTSASVLLMLAYIGAEPTEGTEEDNQNILDKSLDDAGLNVLQFCTEENGFCIGYHRGLVSGTFSDDQAIRNEDGDGPDATFLAAMEEGYATGLEAREVGAPPSPGVAFAAWKNGELEAGAIAVWAAGLNLEEGWRLAVPVTAGSGKTAKIVPAGTPVSVLNSGFEKDGVNHIVVSYDGSALLIPAPEDAPNPLVAGNAVVAQPKSTRKTIKKGDGAKKQSAPRGPSLKDAFIYVIEGHDGGNGPLATNGQIAGRVRKRSIELGIGDKSNTFVQKADKHVPYYCTGYKPLKNKETGEYSGPGRQGIDKPLQWVVTAIDARKYYIKAVGTHEEKMMSIPDEYAVFLDDKEAVIELPEVDAAAVAQAKAEAKKKAADAAAAAAAAAGETTEA